MNFWQAKKNLTLEVTEINEIVEKLIDRIDYKINTLKTIETRADQKIALLDGLITKLKNMNCSIELSGTAEEGCRNEVQSLAGKGFKPEQISRILNLPSGEVELILNLVH